MELEKSYSIEESAQIPAPADVVYRIVADYRHGHPRILPPQFRGLTVEQGGFGEGTIVRFGMRIFGRTQAYRAAITEPEPGRVLVETDLDFNQAVTTFTVGPADRPDWSIVSISTRLKSRSDALRPIERLITTWVLRPIYRRQLQILAKVASEEKAKTTP